MIRLKKLIAAMQREQDNFGDTMKAFRNFCRAENMNATNELYAVAIRQVQS